MFADDTAPSMAINVFTIGHSTRSVDEVVRMLRSNDVTMLADVRSFPSSRAFPQWNQTSLIEALPDDIDYRWIRDLGGRRHTPAGMHSGNEGWRVKAFRDYADYMSTPSFRTGIDTLLTLANHQVTAIMCSEAVPWRCHRRLITDALLVRGVQVSDIMTEDQTRTASLTPFARVDAGSITYPREEPNDDPA